MWSPDGARIAAVGDDGTVRVWDGKTGAELLALRPRVPPGQRDAQTPGPLQWSPDGNRLLASGADGVAVIWDARPFPLALSPPAAPMPRAK